MRKNFSHCFLWALLLTLGIASCGFTPVYGPNSKIATELSDIVIAPPKSDRASYLFVRELEFRIGRNLDGGKVLEHDIQISEQGFVIAVNRIRMTGRANYKVISIKDNKLLFSGSVDNFVSYNADDSVLSTASRKPEEQLIAILADQITTELIGRFSDPANE